MGILIKSNIWGPPLPPTLCHYLSMFLARTPRGVAVSSVYVLEKVVYIWPLFTLTLTLSLEHGK